MSTCLCLSPFFLFCYNKKKIFSKKKTLVNVVLRRQLDLCVYVRNIHIKVQDDFFSSFTSMFFCSYYFCSSIIKTGSSCSSSSRRRRTSKKKLGREDKKKEKKNEEIEIVIGSQSRHQCCVETRVPFERVKVKSYNKKKNRIEGTHMFILHH